MNMRKYRLMEELDEGTGGGGGGNPPAPAPGPTPPAPPAPAPGPTPPAPPAPSPAPGPTPPASSSAPVAAKWPDNWRDEMAAGDEKVRKQLERFASPKDVTNAWRAMQTKLSSGELRSTLPKDAKPEEIAKWREENGVPDKPEGYKLPDGVVVGDADKPHIDGFLKTMHAKNASPELVQEGIKYYYQMQEAAAAQIAEADVAHKTEMEDTLRAEWGGEYRANVNAIEGMLAMAPGGIQDKIFSARMGDGRAIMNDPDVLRWFATTARELNPVATVVPAGGDQMGAINDEIAGLKKMMGDKSSDYWKGPNAEKNQARYRQLVEARDRRAK